MVMSSAAEGRRKGWEKWRGMPESVDEQQNRTTY